MFIVFVYVEIFQYKNVFNSTLYIVLLDVDQSRASNSNSFIVISKSHQIGAQTSSSTVAKLWFSKVFNIILPIKNTVFHYLIFETWFKMIYI